MLIMNFEFENIIINWTELKFKVKPQVNNASAAAGTDWGAMSCKSKKIL